ncbi:Uncharacterized protein family (UPF0051) [Ruminococcus sp. YE71]|uniref:SufB/SufD family protein n=1 Tax=unclassified Ruminococcus TaxID=2608920 RepID=UPI0008897234|nr:MULTISPECIES: SufD family Fe-S cluster assembly protein [unclassified Ruminococcus]SDA19203.1 Uncharacterized protein family (UPF0051) [Ruminococcus sp. YE78]SFW28464.1 Uncharacterized protein family (UPF0051) [Ruminococcus sp. YE71]
MQNNKLNILPVPTFSWLKVNGVELDVKENETSERAAARHEINAKEGESKNSLIYIDSSENVEVQVNAAVGSKVKLVQIFDSEAKTIAKITANVADDANFELVQLYLGRDTVSEILTDLSGRKSQFTADIAYLLYNEDKLDVNLVAVQTGRKSNSEINVKGVLNGKSAKTFKGTIDFRNGAVGAKGAEKEEVLLLSDDVVNKTVPLILCAEEDVDGSHGASIGRLDENQVYYMQSRGIPEEKITTLLAKSKIAQIIKKIGDEQTEKQILDKLGWGDDDE